MSNISFSHDNVFSAISVSLMKAEITDKNLIFIENLTFHPIWHQGCQD